ARQTAFGEAHRPDPGDALAHEQHLSRARDKKPGQQVDQGRLAGTVRPDHRDDFLRRYRDADVAQGAQFAVILADASRFEQRGHGNFRARRQRRSSARAASPPGNPMTMTARTALRMRRRYGVGAGSGSGSRVRGSAPMMGPKKWEKPPTPAMNTSWPDCVQ